jgi:hypothetical protein
MQDEARNTGHRSSLWGGNTRLRARPIGFVSAGLIEPLKDETQKEQDDGSSKGISEVGIPIEGAIHQPPVALPTEEQDLPGETAEQPLDSTKPSTSPGPAALTFTAGTSPRGVIQPEAMGFIIDVTGDKTLAANLSKSAPRIADPQSSADESDSSSEVILFKGRNKTNWGREAAENKRTVPSMTLDTIRYEIKAVEAEIAQDTDKSSNQAVSFRARSRSRGRHARGEGLDEEEDAIIADYIANMAEDSDEDEDERPSRQPFLSVDLGADHGGFGHDNSESSVFSDDSAASDDDQEGEIAMDRHVLSGQNSDDDNMASPTMDDETLARLLAKQEELGMGSDELLLASGVTGGRGLAYYGNSPRKSRYGKGTNNRNPGTFRGASAVADAFDDLDLMDWERPSLQNQRKGGRRGPPPVFGLSDSEMEQKLQAAWQKDRESKKSRKMRREELRSQGLLGKHADPDDPRLRYPNGMTLEDIKAEMRSFLEGSEPR